MGMFHGPAMTAARDRPDGSSARPHHAKTDAPYPIVSREIMHV